MERAQPSLAMGARGGVVAALNLPDEGQQRRGVAALGGERRPGGADSGQLLVIEKQVGSILGSSLGTPRVGCCRSLAGRCPID